MKASGEITTSINDIDLNIDISYPLPDDPIAMMNHIIDKSLNTKKYIPITSKGGLGFTQGTKGNVGGISFDSYWEYGFYIYMTEIAHKVCERNTKDYFYYKNSEGKQAKFYPDFRVNGDFCEVKGIFRPDDYLKKEATRGLVKFYGPSEMKKILEKVNKYKPGWKKEYVKKK